MEIEITTEEIAHHFYAMGHSVSLINNYLDNAPEDMEPQEVEDSIGRNARHLEHMLTKDFWTTEDMTEVEAAITRADS